MNVGSGQQDNGRLNRRSIQARMSFSTKKEGLQLSPLQNDQQLLSWDEIEEVYREPFILSGYRPSGLSWLQCVKHAFVLHNDVGNFWTHFMLLPVWVVWLVSLARSREDFFQAYNYPMLCFWAGACSYALFSSLAHLFSCKSFLVRTVCFILDYMGIAMYALGSDIASLFYLNPASSQIYRYRNIVLFVEVAVATFAIFLCGLSRFYWRDLRFVIRAFAYAVPYCFAFIPYLHRLIVCEIYGTDCVPETFMWHMLSVVFANLLTFFFVTKVPERFFPGKFDRFFQSHQLFHLSAAGLTSVQMCFLPMEVRLRKDLLSEVEGAMPTWQTTLFPFVCAEVLGLGVVCGLGYLAKTGVLTTNKYDRSRSKSD